MEVDWLEPTQPVEKAGLPAVIAIPDDYKARLTLLEECWGRLSLSQKTFLMAWRDCRFNARAASRTVLGYDATNGAHTRWTRDPDYATVMKIWRANAAADALDKDRLLARQDEIVETLLTPKPVLHQGIAVLDPRDPNGTKILEEVDAGAASRANEVLLDRAMPKPRADVEVAVGVQLPAITVELTERKAGKVIDAPCVEVDVTPPNDEDWLK